ncbi:unnamed protein product [Urochloa decumbens]|uniref:F-box domain-containing protein n=1 Tax=Urochloa decumbens TaxID=240449 RepID=A0ABC8ZY19_9POAL
MDPLQPAALMEELVEEVLVRIPPDDPASLVRAALVCKRWCRLISGASFRRRFRELHLTPPMLGFLYERYSGVDFVQTSSFRPPHAFREDWRMLDARHGRVLVMDVGSFSPMDTEFIVWDPVTDGLQKLPILEFHPSSWSAALLCTTAGCDHLDCRGGPFLVVVVVTDVFGQRRTSAYTYSSEQGAWSEPITVQHHNDCILRLHRALVGNALYFNYELNTRILEYDLVRRELSIINLPSKFHGWHIVLMEAEDGRLGFATIQESKMSVWSRESGPDGYAGWAQQRVIELDKLQPVSDCNLPVSPDVWAIAYPPYVVAVADSVSVIFMWTDGGLFTIDLKSNQFKRIGEFISNFGVVPYTSFCTPALSVASMGDEEPRADASSA